MYNHYMSCTLIFILFTHECVYFRPSPNTPSGRGVMSIAGLSYGVVRVEEPGSITSLTLQDVGLVMPGGVSVCLWICVYVYVCVCVYVHVRMCVCIYMYTVYV